MLPFRIALSFLLLTILAPSGVAHAAVLVSPLVNSAAGHQLQCTVVNTSKKETTATVSLHTNSGGIIVGPSELVIPAGSTRSVGSNWTAHTYCKVVASKKKVRANYAIEEDIGGSDFRTIVSVPVQ